MLTAQEEPIDTTISLPTDLFAVLEQRARQLHTSPDALAASALQQYLSHDEQTWRAELAALIARVQRHSASIPVAAIEDDITAAVHDVREARCAARRSA